MHIAEAFETGEQPAHVDLEPPKSARHKISGIAVTWDAEHLYFLPASEGVQDGLPPQHIIHMHNSLCSGLPTTQSQGCWEILALLKGFTMLSMMQ